MRRRRPARPTGSTPRPRRGCPPPEDDVLSDVHLHCPPGRGWSVTRFAFARPPCGGTAGWAVDVDGDADVCRATAGAEVRRATAGGDADGLRTAAPPAVATATRAHGLRPRLPPPLMIYHARRTPLAGVGLQVWRGGLALADALLAGPGLGGATVLELGCGPGVAGLAAARAGAARVFLTDAGGRTLANAALNAATDAAVVTAAGGAPRRARVRRLDWRLGPPRPAAASARPGGARPRFAWTPADVAGLAAMDLVLAGDCVYSDSATDALVACIAALLRGATAARGAAAFGGRPCALVCLERRYNFALADVAARAHAADHFCSLFDAAPGWEGGGGCASSVAGRGAASATAGGAAAGRPPQTGGTGRPPGRCRSVPAACLPGRLVGRQLRLPPPVLAYDRGPDVELWQLWLRG